jgi:hypothetical protein
MSLSRFVLGLLLAAIALAPIGLGASAVRHRVVPSWTGLDAFLADITIALTLCVVTAEILGCFGAFRTAPVVVVFAGVGITLWLSLRRRTPTVAQGATPAAASSARAPRAHVIVSALAVASVTGSWVARTHLAIERGMETVDTMWYHLPVAARFVQTGHVTSVHYVDGDSVTAFFPATSSLLHGVGMLFFGTDLASTVVNLGWLALAFAAAWSVGSVFGVAPVTVTGAALLFATPGLVSTQPGGAYTDVVGLALLALAAAFLLHATDGPRPAGQDLLVALAAGLSIGTKFTFVGPAAALGVGLVVTAARGTRTKRLLLMAGAFFAAGGFWYLRNLVVTGNPIPTLDLHLGPLSLSSLPSASPTSTVAHFAFDARAWRDYFVPGLRASIGPAWPIILVATLSGVVLGTVVARTTEVRLLAVVGGCSLVLFALTPQYLVIGARPYFFVYNLRYATPALLLGLLVLPLAWVRARTWILAGYAFALALTQLDPTSWPTQFDWAVIQDRAVARDAVWGVASALIVAGIWIFASATRRATRVTGARTVAAALVACASVVLVLAHGSYGRHRYANTPPFPATYASMRDIHSSRILVDGLLAQEQYPLYGSDLSNRVQFSGVVGKDGRIRPVASCAEWARQLRDGNYEYVLITPPTITTDAPRDAVWTEQLGGKLVHSETRRYATGLLRGTLSVRVYRMPPGPSPARAC